MVTEVGYRRRAEGGENGSWIKAFNMGSGTPLSVVIFRVS